MNVCELAAVIASKQRLKVYEESEGGESFIVLDTDFMKGQHGEYENNAFRRVWDHVKKMKVSGVMAKREGEIVAFARPRRVSAKRQMEMDWLCGFLFEEGKE